MKEARFRAWDRVQKKMTYYVSVYSEGSEWWWTADHINPDTGDAICSFLDTEGDLMQYTGKKDKDGKRVFASDIIAEGGNTGVIEWDDAYAKWCYRTETATVGLYCFYGVVKGNIYESPGLMP